MLTLQPLDPTHDEVVRKIFRTTLLLGSPLDFPMPAARRYERLCLDWYLGPGRNLARLIVHDGRPDGYVLICTDHDAYQRWVRPRAVAYTAAALTSRSSSGRGRRFAALRVRDGWTLRKAPKPMPVHAHLNLDRGVRGSAAARTAVSYIDAVCAAQDARGWYGEINAPTGRRAAALERLIGPVVHRAPNHTYSWLLGEPVERLTVVRAIGTPTTRHLVALQG